MIQGREYQAGRRYEIRTLADIFETYAGLPPDRQSVFLAEICTAIQVTAPAMAMVSLTVGFLGGEVLRSEPIVWIDDDEGKGQVSFNDEAGANLLRFDVQMQAADR